MLIINNFFFWIFNFSGEMSYVLIVQPNSDKKDGGDQIYDFENENPGIEHIFSSIELHII